MRVVVSHDGMCFESNDLLIDPDSFNDRKNEKQEYDLKVNPEVGKLNVLYAEADKKIRNQQLFENKITNDPAKEYQIEYNQLNEQCQALKELISINTDPQLIQEIIEIEKQLIKIESLIKKHKVKYSKAHLKSALEAQPQQSFEFVISSMDTNQIAKMESRVNKIFEKLGPLKQVNQSYYYKGIEFIGEYNPRETVTFQQSNNQITDIDPMTVMQHIQSLQCQLKIVTGDEQIQAKLLQIQEALGSQKSKNASGIDQVQQIGKQYQQSLKVIDELPDIIKRLKSLKNLHDQTAQLSNNVSETSELLAFILSQVQQIQEILKLLE